MKIPIDTDNLNEWYLNECNLIENISYARILKEIGLNLEQYIFFPEKALLLWDGCIRKKYHAFPNEIKHVLTIDKIKYNSLSNGPAINSYQLAQGKRPNRRGNSHGWSIHHIYNGDFPYHNNSIHAVKEGKHFTQSAGLLAAHPLADALFEEFDIFAWYVRAKAYQKFGYDPDQVFNNSINDYGFADNISFEVIYSGNM